MDVDTSSYPKAANAAPVSLLDNVQKLGGLQQQQQQIQSGALTIDKQKLDLVNQRFGEMAKGFTQLINDKDLNVDKINNYVTNQVKLGYVPAEMAAQTMSGLPPTQGLPPDQARNVLKTALEQHLQHAQTMQEAINYHAGQPATMQDNANIYSGTQDSASKGGAFHPASTTPIQLPPTTPNVGNNPQSPDYNQPGYLGPSGSAGPRPYANPGVGPQTAPAGTPPPLSAPPGPVTDPSQGNLTGSPQQRPTGLRAAVAQPVAPQSPRVVSAPPPNFDVGQKLYANDQATATSKSTALKPLEEAYDLAKSVSTGPGTENLNKARAYLHNLGIIKAGEKDPVVIYAELNKNLAQFVDKNGSRSDADLAVKESGNANAKTQIQPALLHMVQKIIGRERIEIARPQAFEGSDYQNYGKHSASFPTSQDERAYGIDKMPADEAKALYAEMRTKALAGNPEGIRFMKSLSTAKKVGVINGINQ